jgi:hypothetical protein
MSLLLWAFLHLAARTGASHNAWLLGGGGALVGLVGYLGTTLLLGSPEPRLAWAALRKRLRR